MKKNCTRVYTTIIIDLDAEAIYNRLAEAAKTNSMKDLIVKIDTTENGTFLMIYNQNHDTFIGEAQRLDQHCSTR